MLGPEPHEDADYDDHLDGECCQNCGGEGFMFDCFDGFCADAEIGCDDCTRPCSECAIRNKSQL